jgi:hypothetical protein
MQYVGPIGSAYTAAPSILHPDGEGQARWSLGNLVRSVKAFFEPLGSGRYTIVTLRESGSRVRACGLIPNSEPYRVRDIERGSMGKVLEFKRKETAKPTTRPSAEQIEDLEQTVLKQIDADLGVGIIKGAFSKAEFEEFVRELDAMEDE